MHIKDLSAKLLALGLAVLFIALVLLYTREFPVFTNTIGAGKLTLGAMLTGALLAGSVLYGFRKRLLPLEEHLPEVGTTVVFCILFAPLCASLLNRASGTTEYESFEFVSEMPYLSSNYGLLKGEKLKPTGIRLKVKEQDKLYLFQYKKQEYFPNTEPGEKVLLPMRKGLLGFRVLELE